MSTCPTCKATYPDTMRLCPTDGTVLEGGQGPRDENVGRSLDGKYRLDKRLSSGGMGTVYKATHLMLGKALAVKLIKADLPASSEVVRRFQREAKAASNLNHPNIVPAYDLGQTQDGTLYIAMEYINGPSLKDVIQAGPIDPARTIDLLKQVASALSLAHKHDIIHRDLKPQNIMISKDDNGREVAKLLDFGIAKTLDDSATQLTATGFSLGTPQYMSPEQAYGRPVDGRSDLYSLGIILYEMLVGEVPFSDPSTPAVLVKQMTEAPIPPALKRPDRQTSPELAAIALRCLEKDPANRFQTADEFSAALDAAALAIGATVLPLPGQITGGTGAHATPATVVIGKPTYAQTTKLPTPASVPVPSLADQATIRAAAAATVAASVPAPSPAATTQPAATVVVRPAPPVPPAPAAVPAAPLPQPAAAKSGGSGARAGVAAVAAVLLLGGAAYGAYRMGLIGGAAGTGTPAATAASDPSHGAAGGPPASPANPPSSSTPPAGGDSSGPPPSGPPSPPPPSAPSPSTAAPAAGAANAAMRAPSGTTSSPAASPATGSGRSSSAAAPGPPQGSNVPPQSQAAASPPAPAPAPPAPASVNPSVAFQCQGPPDVCSALRSAMDQALKKDSMTSVRDATKADVALDSTVTLVDEQTQQMFGTTFTIRNYTIDVIGDARATSESVPMPAAATLNYDARYRDRLDEKARTVAASVVEHIREYWKKRRP
jgi:eukaryotic-like serine/threonine-protein kinase